MAAPSPAVAVPRRRQRQQRLGRARPAVQHSALALPLPVCPTAPECGALLKAIIKHLLFQRAQIPYLYDELLRGAQEQQRAAAEAAAEVATAGGGRRPRRQRTHKGDRRLLKFLGKAEELLASVDAALATLGVPSRCFLLLGSSTAKPREAYEILLPAPAEAAAAGPAAPAAAPGMEPAALMSQQGEQQPGGRPRPSRQQRLCQLAVRQLVAAGAELPEGTAHMVPCKLFLLLEGCPSGSSSSSSSGSRDMAGGPGEQQQLATAVPTGFSVKRQFKLSMRKGLHLHLLLGELPAFADAGGPAAHQQQLEQGVAAAAAPAAECSMEASQGNGAAPTVHLSQLPDVASQPLPDAAQPDGTAASVAATAAGRDTAGSVWYLCRTVLKGLNSGSNGNGAAQSFDGL